MLLLISIDLYDTLSKTDDVGAPTKSVLSELMAPNCIVNAASDAPVVSPVVWYFCGILLKRTTVYFCTTV